MAFRKPSSHEIRLLLFLANLARDALPADWTEYLRVEEMDDGGMGSLKLSPQNTTSINRSFGSVAASCQFVDDDGTRVVATLYLDQHGVPLELDMWKVDFSPLIRIPTSFEPLDDDR